MMDGVTILHQTIGGGCLNHEDTMAFIIAFLACVLSILLWIVIRKRHITFKSCPAYIISVCCTMFLAITMILSGVYARKMPTYDVYKVTVEPDVSFVEFFDTYEVLDQESDIYTIRERIAE